MMLMMVMTFFSHHDLPEYVTLKPKLTSPKLSHPLD